MASADDSMPDSTSSSSSSTSTAGASATPAATTMQHSNNVERVRHLVVDSGAIIKEIPLHELADHLWTVPDVITEIRDRRARHVLESLPKRLQLREPSAEALRFIVDFSRRTGDFRSISDADIKVLALCYDLEKDINGTAHLRKQPYHELHTSDVTGKPLFVCKRSQRPAPPPRATLVSVVDAIRDMICSLYGVTDRAAVGMDNKFHRSAVVAMARKYSEREAIGILDQYRSEIAAQGKEKGVHVKRIGQWFSGQLKQLSNQLKEEFEERRAAEAKLQAKTGSEPETTSKTPAPLTGAAAMRALAKARRAKGGSAWGSPAPTSSVKAGDDPNFPKLVVTRESHASIVRVGSYVDIRSNTSIAVAPDDESVEASPHERGAFASGRVVDIADSPQEGVPAMARVHLQWNLADGSPATLHTPVTNLVVRPDDEGATGDDREIVRDNTGSATSPGGAALPAADTPVAVADNTARVSFAINDDPVAEASAPPERPAVKSRILPSSGGGLSTTEYVLETDEDDGGEWVTPANIGSHLGHDGFTKAFSTAPSIPAVGCITTDFAMQNVMLQVGLNLLSAGGLQIQRVRQWVLYCGACFHEMRDMERLFCARCGSAGVSKLAVSLTRQGKLRRHFSSNRKVKLKGERYSLPKPKGGRTLDLLLREDQLLAGGWRQQAKKKGLNHSFAGEHVLGSLGMRVGAGSNVVVGMGRTNPNAQRGRERRGKKAKAVHGGKGGRGRRR